MKACMRGLLAAFLFGGLFSVPASAQSEARLVAGWYRTYLHRRPDPEGLQNCILQLRNGETPNGVKAGLLGSDEYYQLHGSRPWGFVRGLYDDTLGRPPSRREVDYWLRRLDQVGSRQTLALEFVRWANNL